MLYLFRLVTCNKMGIKWYDRYNQSFTPTRKDLHTNLTKLILDCISEFDINDNQPSRKYSGGFEVEYSFNNNIHELDGRYVLTFFGTSYTKDGIEIGF